MAEASLRLTMCVALVGAPACVEGNPEYVPLGTSSDSDDGPTGATASVSATMTQSSTGDASTSGPSTTDASTGSTTADLGAPDCAPGALCWTELAVWIRGLEVDSLAAGDLEGVGSDQLVFAEESSAWIIYADAAPRLILSGAASLGQSVVTDLDADGDQDVLLSQGSVRWLRGPEFAPQVFVTPTGIGVTACAVGDVDGDGTRDVVSLHAAALRVWHANGDTTFTEDVPAQFDTTAVDRLVGLDAGPRYSAAFALAGAGEVVAIARDANAWAQYEINVPGVVAIAVADLDDDGAAELVAATSSPAELVAWSRVVGQWTFVETLRMGLADPPLDLATGDFDADGFTDLVVADETTVLKIFRGAGDLTFVESEVDVGVRPIALAIGDLDGNGRDDVGLVTDDHRVAGLRSL